MSIVSVSLRRDGPGTAWGFRLQGGRDVGCPLTIQRVFLGSPSEGEIQRGDVLLQVGNKDATKLTHMEAHDIIKNSGNNLNLAVQRSGGLMSPGMTPITPPFKPTGHPLANVKPLPSSGFKPSTPGTPKAFQPVAPQPSASPYRAPWVKQPTYIPPPTSAKIPSFMPTPETFADVEAQEFYTEHNREQQAIVNQAYRTFPLISPHAKPRHDLPTGSYLRHVQDPSWKKMPSAPPQFNRVIMDTPGKGPHVVHSQYNSPINLYSQQNISDTYAEQTGMQPHLVRSAAKKTLPKPSANPAAKGGGERMATIVDITKSPTYQMIQEEESKLSPKSEGEEQPRSTPQKRMYVHPLQCGEEHGLNAFGVPRDKILQSGSFRSLMTVINTQSDF